jgi:hypothetical protein
MAKKVIKEEIIEVETVTDVENTVEVKEEIEVPKVINPNEVFIEGKGLLKIKPTKLKYFKDNTYNNCMLVKTMGINEVLKYEDGEEIIKKFLGAVFDVDSSTIDFIDDMTTKTLFEIISKANIINEIKENDFFSQLAKTEVIEKA